MSVQRTVLLTYRDGPVSFRLERWFMPLDAVQESIARPVLVWQDETETKAVALGPRFVRELIAELQKFA